MALWEVYNRGEADNIRFLNKDGTFFSGQLDCFEAYHGILTGFKNKITGVVILINENGEVAARGTDTPEYADKIPFDHLVDIAAARLQKEMDKEKERRLLKEGAE